MCESRVATAHGNKSLKGTKKKSFKGSGTEVRVDQILIGSTQEATSCSESVEAGGNLHLLTYSPQG